MSDHVRILDEHRIDLSEAGRILGTDRSPAHLSTVLRAVTKGTKLPAGERVRLEAIRSAGRWVTSREAVERYVRRLTGLALGEAEPTESPVTPMSSRRQRELAAVDRELDRAGI
jgi:hypothetical protein